MITDKERADFRRKKMVSIKIPECLALTVANILRVKDSIENARAFCGSTNMDLLAEVFEQAGK